MNIGVPREIKPQERRVALTPDAVGDLTASGHDVFVEAGAGAGSAFPDAEYATAGAKILDSADEVWGQSELVCKVKEPVVPEFDRMQRGQALFTYLHLAASRPCTDGLLARGVTAIAYETVRGATGGLPLLAPMSEVAGRLASQVGAEALRTGADSRGMLLGGVPGTPPAKVVIIGAGVSGVAALQIALGLRADVTILDRDLDKLRQIDLRFGNQVTTLASTATTLEREVLAADLVIGAVLVAGARAPKLVTNSLVARMKRGSVLVDIAIDQGGCFEDSRPTTHEQPTFRVHDSVFYCVANMPGSVPNTATNALTNATLPYVRQLADKGWRAALRADDGLAEGLATWDGQLVSAPVGAAHGIATVPLATALA
ncbi:alanine dehydrogenase [Blastococcus goldschmidtiae]|uniref:Alanine dehydrogenase n=1 Tax=Blastococcus goldschmidtiae TaxID=3075546 RepID=A0ABU2K953_9ACTN|nr:alanine dehydrogenase [Blastococcus sp. DSM 46792]MDT0276725.1 alanine dehydrogenase [Blastococcus sp. DSM 46792]